MNLKQLIKLLSVITSSSSMLHHYLLLCLFGILACITACTEANEAIVGAQKAKAQQSLYQVSVQLFGNGLRDHACGGGIIDDKFVVTAAHCILNKSRQLRSKPISVLAGTRQLNKTDYPAVIIRVKTVFFPKEFHPTIVFPYGNIAILKLVESLPLKNHNHFKKLELPRNYNYDRVAEIAGFGWNYYCMTTRKKEVGHTDGFLRVTQTNILAEEICEDSYPIGAIESSLHLCAKTHESISFPDYDPPYGVCITDIGGPLVQNETVIGILSRIAPDCDERDKPAIYTRIAYYVPMIYNVIHHNRDPHMISLHAI